MTSLVEGAKRLVGRGGSSVGERLAALETASATARGRLDDALVDRADAVVRRGAGRLALSGDHTVVALAGATGSGKSSTFNALSGVPIAAVSVRRPTTSATTGVAWGADDAAEVLDWLGVQRRHQVTPEAGAAQELDGLVLLDLPDHDSTEVAHHLEVDRLVQLVDTLVWVLDPQKYADAAIHERYLRPLASHRDVMIVVLNHIDEVAPADRPRMVEDLKKLLAADGLGGVPVIATSATLGDGIGELRALVARRVREKKAVAARLSADVTAVAQELQRENGSVDPGQVRRADRSELVDAFADAAGVPTVTRAVQRSVARRGSQHTGWLVTSWLTKLKPDPLKRLHRDVPPTAASPVFGSAIQTPETLARPSGELSAGSAVPGTRPSARDLRDRIAREGVRRDRIESESWRREWRQDRRYDWRRHRNRDRSRFHLGIYIDPFGWGYRDWDLGWRLPAHYYSSRYWIHDPLYYRLPPVGGPYRWIRYHDDVLLVDLRSGRVLDRIRRFFW